MVEFLSIERRWALCMCGLVVALALGCEKGPSVVSGKVTLDGKPIQKGVISFIPTAGDTPGAAGQIVDGNYTAEVPPGPKRVEITGYEVVGKEPAYPGSPNSPMVDVQKAIVPPQFNAESSLTVDIKAGSNDNVNFDLDSKSK